MAKRKVDKVFFIATRVNKGHLEYLTLEKLEERKHLQITCPQSVEANNSNSGIACVYLRHHYMYCYLIVVF